MQHAMLEYWPIRQTECLFMPTDYSPPNTQWLEITGSIHLTFLDSVQNKCTTYLPKKHKNKQK